MWRSWWIEGSINYHSGWERCECCGSLRWASVDRCLATSADCAMEMGLWEGMARAADEGESGWLRWFERDPGLEAGGLGRGFERYARYTIQDMVHSICYKHRSVANTTPHGSAPGGTTSSGVPRCDSLAASSALRARASSTNDTVRAMPRMAWKMLGARSVVHPGRWALGPLTRRRWSGRRRCGTCSTTAHPGVDGT